MKIMGEFTEADKVIVETLYNKMKKDENVQKEDHAVQAALADKLYRELHP